MGYDRGDSFDFEANGIAFGSKSKGKKGKFIIFYAILLIFSSPPPSKKKKKASVPKRSMPQFDL